MLRSNKSILSSSYLTNPDMDDQLERSTSKLDSVTITKSVPSYTKEDVEVLRDSLSAGAKLAEEGDLDYEEGIKRWSKAAEKRAGIIVFPKTAEDVSKAVKFTVRNKLDLAVCGGGHGTSGASSTSGGLCINLSSMRRVTVNVEKKSVTAEGGALWKDVDMAAGKAGLACVGGTVNHTGIGGLTLGGGYSYLSPAHGLTIDNLLSVEFVLADGNIVTASLTENADLFWAARGAGSSFGVATKFTYKAHPQPKNIWIAKVIFDGVLAHDQVIKFANDLLERGDSKSWMFVGSGHMPPRVDKASIVCICFYNGSMEEAMSVYGPLTELPNQFYSKICLMPYYEVNGFINEGLEHGHRRSMKGCAFIPSPTNSPEVARNAFKPLNEFVEKYPDAGHSFVLLEFIPFGKICEVEQTATAFANRGAYGNILYIMSWDSPDNDELVRGFSREQVDLARKRFEEDRAKLIKEGNIDTRTASSVGEYFNHEGTRSDGEAVFGPNYERLAALKKRYDPSNLFNRGAKLI